VRDDDLPLRLRVPAAAYACGDDAPMAGHVARLRAAIARLACDRRVGGVTLDLVLAEVRGLVREAEGAEGSPDELGVLAGRVARWATEAYLEKPRPRRAPPFD